MPFQQNHDRLTIPLKGVTADPIDTIFKIELSESLPAPGPRVRPTPEAVPPGNLATHKPARLLSNKGTGALFPSAFNFARFGVDGDIQSGACGAYEWPWTYHLPDPSSLCNQDLPISSRVLSFVSGTLSQTNAEHDKQIPKKIRKVPPGCPNRPLNQSSTTGKTFTVA